MYLVDSSVWINAINKADTASALFLKSLSSDDYALMPLIYSEVLQGAKNQKMFDTYKYYLQAQTFYALKDERTSYEQAALIYSSCRKKGITVRSSIDCLIAQCAIENEAILLHNDKDFTRIAGVISTLQQQYTGD